MTDSLKHWRLMPLFAFMDFCHTRSVSESARRMGKAKSWLSTQLRAVEAQLALPLLRHEGGRLFVNEQGLSLAKAIFQLANVCTFCERFADTDASRWQHIVVRIPMRFWGGGISAALQQAVEACGQAFPDIFVYVDCVDEYSDYHYHQLSWLPSQTALGNVTVEYAIQDADVYGQWLVVGDSAAQSWVVPKMPWGVMQALMRCDAVQGGRYRFSDEDYTQWLAKPLAEGVGLLVNRLLLTPSLMQDNPAMVHDLPVGAGIRVSEAGNHPAVSHFKKAFLSALAEVRSAPCWSPSRLSAKQWRYFSALYDSRHFGEAAQCAYISQPALSKQISSMEAALGQSLFVRDVGRRAVTATPFAHGIYELAQAVEASLSSIVSQVNERRWRREKKLSIGILPSVDAKSNLIEMVMGNIDRWQASYADIRLSIFEAPHHQLVQHLQAMDIQLAITEADSPWLVQYPIFAPEPFGLIAPRVWFGDGVPAHWDWQTVTNYPLILPRHNTGMREIMDKHCLTLGFHLQPTLESGSLNLNRSWIVQGRYATIMPASAFHQSLAQGDMVFIPLYPLLYRQLKVSHLRSRRLSEIERSLLQALLGETV